MMCQPGDALEVTPAGDGKVLCGIGIHRQQFIASSKTTGDELDEGDVLGRDYTRGRIKPKPGLLTSAGKADRDRVACARLYRCERLMLLYPAAPHETQGPVRKFGIDGGTEHLAVGRIDVSQETSATVTALGQIAKDLIGSGAQLIKLCC